MKFFISKTKKLPRAAQKQLLPREEFMTKGKERFLAAFDASEPARNAHPARPAYATAFFKVGVGVLAVLAVGVGLSAYADTANVSATNPLYSLKRLGENVQLALAPASEKTQLQATFAVRRANEIAALQASAPSSTLIPELTNNMEQDISASLGVVTNATGTANIDTSDTGSASGAGISGGIGGRNGRGRNYVAAGTTTTATATTTIASSTVNVGAIDIYCSAFDVSTSGILIGHLESDLSLRPDALAQFNRQCGSDSGGYDRRERHSAGSTTTTTIVIPGTVTANTTVSGSEGANAATSSFGGDAHEGQPNHGDIVVSTTVVSGDTPTPAPTPLPVPLPGAGAQAHAGVSVPDVGL
jgi:hypothetical protein